MGMDDYEFRLHAAAEMVLSADDDGAAQGRQSLEHGDFGVTAVLKPYQVDGVNWLIRRYELGVNVLLGDEMGLGKTLQAISLLSYLKIHSASPGPFLVLCPLSVTNGWALEFDKFCPSLKVVSYVGDKVQRLCLRRSMYEHVQIALSSPSSKSELSFDVMLTTYDIALADQDFLSQIPWHYTVVDEAQRLKNHNSVLYNVLVNRYIMPRRLLVTGTPIQNNLTELWSLMHFCMPSLFGTLDQFLSTFKKTENVSFGDETNDVTRQLKFLRKIMRAFMLRRTKVSLIEKGTLSLPPLTEITMSNFLRRNCTFRFFYGYLDIVLYIELPLWCHCKRNSMFPC